MARVGTGGEGWRGMVRDGEGWRGMVRVARDGDRWSGLVRFGELVKDGKIGGVVSSNVDDLLYGSLLDFEQEIDDVLKEFKVKQKAEGEFRYAVRR